MDDEYAILSDSDKAEQRKRANFKKKKICKIISLVVALCILGMGVLAVMYSWSSIPTHASCRVKLNWPSSDCIKIKQSIVNQIQNWTTRENCLNGGQKCLYNLVSEDTSFIKATHTTPVKAYVDTITFSFANNGNNDCNVDAFSSSNLWYAVLDYGTNYCNIHNLITGSGLSEIAGFVESTSDKVCTQYSSADCNIY